MPDSVQRGNDLPDVRSARQRRPPAGRC
jgi:hypothetical protein